MMVESYTIRAGGSSKIRDLLEVALTCFPRPMGWGREDILDDPEEKITIFLILSCKVRADMRA
ncbi:MAG: hypothetical protein PHQ81_05810 [Methanofollis sp.]|nr:hypothetical protein [Methanofollis sp.]